METKSEVKIDPSTIIEKYIKESDGIKLYLNFSKI